MYQSRHGGEHVKSSSYINSNVKLWHPSGRIHVWNSMCTCTDNLVRPIGYDSKQSWPTWRWAMVWHNQQWAVSRIQIRPGGYKTLFISTQMSTKFILLINVKMPTIVGILTFISTINTTSERLKARHIFICWYFSFHEQLKIDAQLTWAWKCFYNLEACLGIHYLMLSCKQKENDYTNTCM